MSINYIAVLVAGVASMLIGYVWFSPALFGKTWMKVIGSDPSDQARMDAMKKGMGAMYALQFLASLVAAYVLARFAMMLGVSTAMGGAKLAFWIWLGFVATIKVGDALFSGKSKAKQMDMFWTTAGYQLVNFLVIGAIIGAWH